MENNNKTNVTEFVPQFTSAFYHPRYWGIWCGIGLIVGATYIPPRLRDPFLGALGRLAGKLAKGARHRARVNLHYCMPELSESAREKIIDEMFATVPQSTVLMAELACRNPERLLSRVRWHGQELIEQATQQQRNIIFLVPHGWAVDVPAMLMSAQGNKVAGMFHNQRNELVDYMWNRVRRRFGGRLHARNDGVKPFVSSVRQGWWGYYLPDQDHGPEHSEFVDFFATYKATLPAIGRLMKICRAAVIPLFPVYDSKTGQLDIYVRPPMDDIAAADDAYIARRMNEEVENLVRPNPEQYTWILKLLKTRKPGDPDPYRR
ncbi:lauroyl-Kdo(2)-lipid IV(A) myristoyltransferase [Acerihabitans sp. TG2]|uniref:lauroyl-Kdo(2)-lipid IV(A) myristoyltransferase n=1 Tax=Acerihabitans sp. TG2 TaxID=3096008 RepID=UPI002B233A28|nr:lauroyl-Kdo(2)-lipid IV(A) myristoyltransferase [Acerihabitans sp. TG2]MEA9392977.1 lauroyl-Kdo(2)-lipid IV(A) myristoyltransferase [Acerihabitans sp. TG2]